MAQRRRMYHMVDYHL